MKNYIFTVRLSGWGDTKEEAWNEAVESFSIDSGPPPDGNDVEIVDEEED